MNKNRLEAFSDGVIAILITIMVLELKVPHGASFAALLELRLVLLSYVLSFVYLGIYWNNHHHLLHTIKRASGGILWANLHLLFWLSLVPFVTNWMGEERFASVPTAIYGFVLLMSGSAYWLLQRAILAKEGPGSLLATALGRDLKGNASPVLYTVAIAAAFVQPWVAWGIYIAVALLWLVPDRRIERIFEELESES